MTTVGPTFVLGYPEVRIPIVAMALYAAGLGAIGVWAGLGRGYWFFRALLLMAALAPLFHARIYEPALCCLFVVTGVATTLAVLRRSGKLRCSETHDAAALATNDVSLCLRLYMVCGGTFLIGLLTLWMRRMAFPYTYRGQVTFTWYETLTSSVFVGGLGVILIRLFQVRLWSVMEVGSLTMPRVTDVRWSFSMRNLLELVLVAGMAFAMVASVPLERIVFNWAGLLGTTASFFVLSVSSSCVVLLRRSWRIAFVTMLLVILSSAILHTWWQSDWCDVKHVVWLDKWHDVFTTFLAAFCLLCSVVLALCYLMLMAGVLRTSPPVSSGERSLRRVSQVTLISLCVAVYLPLGVVLARMTTPIPSPATWTNSTIDFDHVIALSRSVASANPLELTILELRTQCDGTANDVSLAHLALMRALERPTHVRIAIDPDDKLKTMEGRRAFRGLVRMWERETQQLAIRGRWDETVDYEIAVIRLGIMLQMTGNPAYGIVGTAFDANATDRLIRHRHTFSPAARRRLVDILQQINHDRELWNPHARNAFRDERLYGWRSALVREASCVLAGKRAIDPFVESFEDAVKRRDMMRRLLMLDLAITLYKEDTGRYPNFLAQLSPSYLTVVPVDPFSGGSIVYRHIRDTFVLYSGGLDGGTLGTATDGQRDRRVDVDMLNRASVHHR